MQKNLLYPLQLSFNSQLSRNRLNTDFHELLPQIVLDYGSQFWAIFYIISNPPWSNRVGDRSTLKYPTHINLDPVKPVSIDMDVLKCSILWLTDRLETKNLAEIFQKHFFKKEKYLRKAL